MNEWRVDGRKEMKRKCFRIDPKNTRTRWWWQSRFANPWKWLVFKWNESGIGRVRVKLSEPSEHQFHIKIQSKWGEARAYEEDGERERKEVEERNSSVTVKLIPSSFISLIKELLCPLSSHSPLTVSLSSVCMCVHRSMSFHLPLHSLSTRKLICRKMKGRMMREQEDGRYEVEQPLLNSVCLPILFRNPNMPGAWIANLWAAQVKPRDVDSFILLLSEAFSFISFTHLSMFLFCSTESLSPLHIPCSLAISSSHVCSGVRNEA